MLHFILEYVISFKPWMRSDGIHRFLLAAILDVLAKLFGKYFTDHMLHNVFADQSPLFVHSALIRKQ